MDKHDGMDTELQHSDASHRWFVIGGSGFVGGAIVQELALRGQDVVSLSAPRLVVNSSPNESVDSVLRQATEFDHEVESLTNQLTNGSTVINAAGLAQPDSGDERALHAANAVLPVVIARAAGMASCGRLIHLSSAAVLGPNQPLHSEPRTAPLSAYGESKALGEAALRVAAQSLDLDVRVVRGTSVQGPSRPTTLSLRRIARSPIASVAAPGTQTSPVSSARSLARFVIDLPSDSAYMSVQPWDGATVASVLTMASGGRAPIKLPRWLCDTVIAAARFTSRLSGNRLEGQVRRLELMWFGQPWSEPQPHPTPETLADLHSALRPPSQGGHIGILSQWFDPETGPAALPGVYARAFVDAGNTVSVLTGYPNYPEGQTYDGYAQRWRSRELASPDVAVTRVALYASHDASAAKRAANYLTFAVSATISGFGVLRRSHAVWVYNSPVTVSLPLLVHTRFGRIPYFLHVQDIWPDSLIHSGMMPRNGLVPKVALHLVRSIVSLTERRAAVIGVISPSVKDLLLKRNPQLDPNKIVYVPNPTDEQLFVDTRTIPESDRPRVPWEGTFTFMYIGAVGELQGLDLVIDAFKLLGDHRVSLVIVGDGIALDRLQRRSSDEAIQGIHFTGRISKLDVPRYMARSDVQVVSLHHDEFLQMTTPSKIPTTLAAAKPILGNLSGDGARLIEESGAGVVVESGDPARLSAAMRDFAAKSQEELDLMSAAGRSFYTQRLSAQRSAQTILDSLARARNGQR